jgi:hypothetical protein
MFHTRRKGIITSLDLLITTIFILSILTLILSFSYQDIQARAHELQLLRLKSIVLEEADNLYMYEIASSPNPSLTHYRKTGYLDLSRFLNLENKVEEKKALFNLNNLRYTQEEPDILYDNQICHYRIFIIDGPIKTQKKIWVCSGV